MGLSMRDVARSGQRAVLAHGGVGKRCPARGSPVEGVINKEPTDMPPGPSRGRINPSWRGGGDTGNRFRGWYRQRGGSLVSSGPLHVERCVP